jgi:MerR family transcriptional regulator, thiopeptide resistance regulator
MSYTVKQLAELAKVSRRTLHYYDQIGLLKPEQVGDNGYRHYGEQSLYRLQQILFFRELGFSLDETGEILDRRDFDLLRALENHRTGLLEKRNRMDALIGTLERTIASLKGEFVMDDKELFEGFDDPQEKTWSQEAVERWGDEARSSVRKWNAYGRQKQAAIRAEGDAIYQDLAAQIGEHPKSPAVQQIIHRWHDHLGYFYEPSNERMLGLADMYVDDPRFRATFDLIHPDLAPFLRLAIRAYVEKSKREDAKNPKRKD